MVIDTGISQLYSQGFLMRAEKINDGLSIYHGWLLIKTSSSKIQTIFHHIYLLFSPTLNEYLQQYRFCCCEKGIRNFTDCLIGDDCCHLILTSISVTAPSDNIHG